MTPTRVFTLVIVLAFFGVLHTGCPADDNTDGDVTDGDVTDGDVTDGDVTDGDVTDGDVTDGDVTDGDVTDGDEPYVTDGDADVDWADGDWAEYGEEEEEMPAACDEYRGSHHNGDRQDPLNNCSSCHGADLTGGGARSCYSCHNANDHDVNRDGTMHSSNPCCQWCHGPNNTGGIGPACSDCHD